ncbi:chemotaxis protein CheA [Methylobacterium oryzisoli]|uniref:chemotaxis protein CheA n=1 Tax=Methylobacterium oryzisoli TaxID=3385502 RepID=UPI003979B348
MTNALLAQFIPEARELLELAGSGMLALEKSHSPDALNDIFRAVHTLKGTSGLFDIAPLTDLVHAAEDLLVEMRAGELALEPEIVDGLLDSLDLVGHWIDALESREVLPSDAESVMSERVAALRRWLAAPAASAGVAQGPQAAPAWIAGLDEADRIAAYRAAASGPLAAWRYEPDEACFFRGDDPAHLVQGAPGLLCLRAVARAPWPAPETLDPFVSALRFDVLCAASAEEVADHLRYVADQAAVTPIRPADLIVPAGRDEPAEVFDDFAERAAARLAAGDRAGLAAAAEALLRIVGPESRQASALRWIAAVAPDAQAERLAALVCAVSTAAPRPAPPAASVIPFPMASADPAEAALSADRLREVAGEIIAVQAGILGRMSATRTEGAPSESRLDSTLTVLRRCLSRLAEPQAGSLRDALVRAERDGDAAALADALKGLDGTARSPATTPTVPDRADRDRAPAPPAPEALALSAPEHPEARREPLAQHLPAPVVSRPPPQEAAAPVAEVQSPRPADARPAEAEGKGPVRMLRVEQGKVDALMSFVAELTVAKNGLAYLAGRAEQVSGSRQLGREIKEQYAVIDRIAQSLQVGVMAIRMMPVSQVFQRFPRLTRDISRKLGKEVALVIQGEDTEADKNVLESLSDPLIHMVRNALDHGIETPADRRRAGKAPHGTLRLSARQENDNVIEVADDGRGIDTAAVRAKALHGGLITPDQAAQMTPEEIVNLVFAAGFSTKEQVSDLSGRGVGMDVVRSAVRKAGGDVWLTSRVGEGTCVTVQLPLTMAVTRIVTVEVRGQQYGVAMEAVAEAVKVPRGQMHRIKRRETFVLRDAVIPLVRLAESLGLPAQAAEAPEEEAVMVVRIGRERVGIVVDGFRERMEVIVRPLDGLLSGLSGFSGTALLGDGRVLLVLNLPDLV